MKKITIIIVCLTIIYSLVSCQVKNDKTTYEVTISDGEVLNSSDGMKEFYDRTRKKESLIIRIINIGTNNEEYEKIIKYQNDRYYLYDLKNNKEHIYKYLNYSFISYQGYSIVTSRESYCLSNDESFTAETIEQAWVSSSILVDFPEGIIVYQKYQYKDLAFIDTTVEKIIFNQRDYEVNFNNKCIATNVVDSLDWYNYSIFSDSSANFTFEDYKNAYWSDIDWPLKIRMTRKIKNDKNHLIPFYKDEYITVTYIFNLEKGLVLMRYPSLSSTNSDLFAKISDELIKDLDDLFCIRVSQNETNHGEYLFKNDTSEITFSLNPDKTASINYGDYSEPGIYRVNDTTRKLNIYTFDETYYYEFDLVNDIGNGVVYCENSSNPSYKINKVLKDKSFFLWIGNKIE